MSIRIILFSWAMLAFLPMWSQKADTRPFVLYVHDPQENWRQNGTISMETDEGLQTLPLNEAQHFYTFWVGTGEEQIKLHYQDAHKRLWLSEGTETLYATTLGENAFPADLSIRSRDDLLASFTPYRSRVEVYMNSPSWETASLEIPFQPWINATGVPQGQMQPSGRGPIFRAVLRPEILGNTLGFIHIEDRFFPVLLENSSYAEIEFMRLDGRLQIKEFHGLERNQEFLNHRFPFGMTEVSYDGLLSALRDDLAYRADTLASWSQAAAAYGEATGTDMDYFFRMLNRLSQENEHQMVRAYYIARLEIKEREMWNNADARINIAVLILVISGVIGILMVILRSRISPFIPNKAFEWFEKGWFGLFWLVVGGELLFGWHYHILQTRSMVEFFLFAAIVASFHLNAHLLIPRLLMKKRFGRYFAGFLMLIGAIIFVWLLQPLNPFRELRIVNFEGEWLLETVQNSWGYEVVRTDELAPLQMAFLLLSFIFGSARHLVTRRIPQLAQRNEKLSAELGALKSQLSPHFFFNSLNTVYGFALGENSNRTADAITKLSGLMRFVIYHSDQDFIELEAELEYLTDYIELQKLRLDDKRHEVSFRVEGHPGNLKIAPLLLITLIENAFKHGVSMSRDSFIFIDLLIQQDGLILTVENSVHRAQLATPEGEIFTEGGIGLTNTQKRLDLLYKGHYDWQVIESDDRYYSQLSLEL